MENAVVVSHDMPVGPAAVEAVKNHVATVSKILSEVMKPGVHYGTIPGCGDKPTLLQAGAQKLMLAFNLIPKREEITVDLGHEHREYRIITRLYTPSGICRGEGRGICSTMESKHRYRDAQRKCPNCGKETIIKGKAEYGGGWLCFAKKGGCGAKYKEGDKAIEGQECGKIENPNPADQYNTCYKMACKRADVHAAICATSASDIFTQDVEDFADSFRDVAVEAKVISKEVIKDEKGNTVNTATGEVLKRSPEPVANGPLDKAPVQSAPVSPHKVTTPFDNEVSPEQKAEEQAAAAMQDDAPPAGGPEAFAKEVNEQNAATNGEKLITPVQLKAMQTLRGQIGWSPEQLKAWVLKAFPYIETTDGCSSKNLKCKDASFVLSTLEHCVKKNTQPA